jgi:hypothetical protein
MATLTKYRSFDDLKSSESLKKENSLESKTVNGELKEFILALRAAKEVANQAQNSVSLNDQQSER